MPTAHRTRRIAASANELWQVVGDPHHLPRWWPRVSRMEAVQDDAFTEVLLSPKGKIVRADFRLLEAVSQQRIAWAQQVEGTPFERVLKSAETEIELTPLEDLSAVATHVRIELRQEMQGFRSTAGGSQTWISGVSRLGGPLVRRAANATLDEALDGLERIVGRSS